MIKWLKEYGWIVIVAAIILIVIISILIQWFMTGTFSQTSGGTDDGWLGFWGGYLGSLIGIFGTITFTVYYSNKQMEMSRKAQVDAYIKQSQIIAIREYEDALVTAKNELEFMAMNYERDYHVTVKLDDMAENLQVKCERYSLLTKMSEAEGIVNILQMSN